jgi:hypothetical protein
MHYLASPGTVLHRVARLMHGEYFEMPVVDLEKQKKKKKRETVKLLAWTVHQKPIVGYLLLQNYLRFIFSKKKDNIYS